MRFPNPIQFLRSTWNAIKFWWVRRFILTPPEIRKARLLSCQDCPQFLIISRQCGKCTCFVDAKAGVASETCPLGRWAR